MIEREDRDRLAVLRMSHGKANALLLDVMIEVGGLGEFAAGNRARLVRRTTGGEQTVYRVRLEDLLKKGDISANVPMRPGDIVIIPESRF